MTGFTMMLLWTTLAGACIAAGGLVATVDRIRPGWMHTEARHTIIAFGGGALISAVSLVLVPEGTRILPSPWFATFVLLAGGGTFYAFERVLGLRRRETPMLMAMLLDYLPESLALGGMFAVGADSAPLLAVLIGLQNLPEGFNAYRELNALPNFDAGKTLRLMCALIGLGPLVGSLGWQYAPAHEVFLGGVMLFSAGGILYLLFQDVAPQAHLNRRWGPALGAVLGFAVAMLGQMLIAAK